MEKVGLFLFVLAFAVAVGFCVSLASRWFYFKYLKFKRAKRLIKFTRHKRFWLIGTLSALLAIPILAYIYNFKSIPISGSADHWGQMGDFFGGMLNPVLAFASFMALLYTIRIQSEELRLTREELTKSSGAQQKSADSQIKQLQLQKQLEEFKTINRVYLNYMELADEQFRTRISVKDSLFGMATEMIPKADGIEALLFRSIVQQNLRKFSDGAKRAHFYSNNIISAKIQFEKLATLSSMMEDGFDLLLESYASTLSYHLFWAGIFHSFRPLFEPDDITNEVLRASLKETYKNLRVIPTKSEELEETSDQS